MTDNRTFGIILIAIGAVLLFVGLLSTFYDIAYRQGQIDAINGKIEYVLVKQPDNTTKWESKK